MTSLPDYGRASLIQAYEVRILIRTKRRFDKVGVSFEEKRRLVRVI